MYVAVGNKLLLLLLLLPQLPCHEPLTRLSVVAFACPLSKLVPNVSFHLCPSFGLYRFSLSGFSTFRYGLFGSPRISCTLFDDHCRCFCPICNRFTHVLLHYCSAYQPSQSRCSVLSLRENARIHRCVSSFVNLARFKPFYIFFF